MLMLGKARAQVGGQPRQLCQLRVFVAGNRGLRFPAGGVPDGQAVLQGLTAEQIGTLAGQWADFDRAENPSPGDGQKRVDALKKAWSTRLMRAFAGVCSAHSARCPQRNGPEP